MRKFRRPWPGGQQIEIDAAELSSGQAGRSINLPEGKARLINFPVEVGKVLVADPAVADVVVMSSRQIYLIGLSAGATNAFFLDDEGVELLRLEIQVQLDVAAANKSLKTLLPRADIKITVGGVIPPDDVPTLLEMGAVAVYPPGTVIVDAALELLELL